MLTGTRTRTCWMETLSDGTIEGILKSAPDLCVLLGSKLRGSKDALVQPGHFYTVLGTGSRRQVHLRDPHGEAVEIPLAKLQEQCDLLTLTDP